MVRCLVAFIGPDLRTASILLHQRDGCIQMKGLTKRNDTRIRPCGGAKRVQRIPIMAAGHKEDSIRSRVHMMAGRDAQSVCEHLAVRPRILTLAVTNCIPATAKHTTAFHAGRLALLQVQLGTCSS